MVTGGCGGGGSGATASDFAGTWRSTLGTLHQQCVPSQPDPTFNPFYLRFTAVNAATVEVVDTDQNGQTVDNCVFDYIVGGNQASVKPGQQCQDTAANQNVAYSTDVFALSADKMAMDETGAVSLTALTASAGADCQLTFTYRYERAP
jgi:hypothetical protein